MPAPTRNHIVSLLRSYKRLTDSAYRQMGARAAATALKFLDSDQDMAEREAARAEYYLPLAEAESNRRRALQPL